MRKSPVGKRKDVIPSGGSNSADKLNGKIIWRKKRTENGKKKENTSRSLPIWNTSGTLSLPPIREEGTLNEGNKTPEVEVI